MSRKATVNASVDSSFECGCYGLYFIFSLLLGGWSVSYILEFFDKSIPFLACILIGLFTAGVSVPVAIVMWILKLFGAI